jgi:hypothetical protein
VTATGPDGLAAAGVPGRLGNVAGRPAGPALISTIGGDLMIGRVPVRAWALLGILAVAGCGPSDGYRLGRVSGKVTYKGQPVAAGFITFMPDRTKQTEGPPAMSKIAEDGTYTMSTKVADDGAVVGHHQVAIMGIDPKPIVEVAEEDLTPQKIMAAKGQKARQRATPKKEAGETFTDRGGNVYRVLTPAKLKNPEKSGVAVEVDRGSNTINFNIREDGSVEVGS